MTYFDNFGVKYIPKEIKKFIENKNIVTNIYRIQAYNSIMCEYFCTGFADLMLKGESLLEYTNLFSLNKYEKNEKIILIYYQENLNKTYSQQNTFSFSILKWLRWKKSIVSFVINIESLKTLEYHT